MEFPSPLNPTCLSQTVDVWTVQSVAASRYLASLYRELGDEKQAFHAIQTGAPAEERAQRLGLTNRIAGELAAFMEDGSEAIASEAKAWQNLVEAQAGICAFHGMVTEQENARSLQGPRNVANKAFRTALKGYRIAFPEPMVSDGISAAILAATDRCVMAFRKDIEAGNNLTSFSEDIAQHIHHSIIVVLRKEAGLPAIE